MCESCPISYLGDVHKDASVIFCTLVDDDMEDEVHITVLATGFSKVAVIPTTMILPHPQGIDPTREAIDWMYPTSYICR